MARTRKTIDVECVKRIANNMLANSNPYLVESREAIAVLLEHVLMDTGNYHGYKHLSPNNDATNIAGELDDSRRYYY
jgi:hypothetical protein